MLKRLLVCTDLDRTLLPNGPESESKLARYYFSELVSRPEVFLAYVTGRDKKLTQEAISNYSLPMPDVVIADVGSTIYQLDNNQWSEMSEWEQQISQDWNGLSHHELKVILSDISALRLQESHKQAPHKLSFYIPLQVERDSINQLIKERLRSHGVDANLIWSTDEPAGVGLLDVLPRSASKFHAIEAVMKKHRYSRENTIFSGDSGNDIEVLESPILSTLVANSQNYVRETALEKAKLAGNQQQLYIANGSLTGLNGNYSAGIIEGIIHYFPECKAWLDEIKASV